VASNFVTTRLNIPADQLAVRNSYTS
jgi:Fungalysin/Thermolysin Propeptide Motif